MVRLVDSDEEDGGPSKIESEEDTNVGCWRVFFFSSRRRHTRWTGDWSSDVCSSDLSWPLAAVSSLVLPRTTSKVQWAGTESAFEVVRGRTSDETAASGHEAGIPRGVCFLLPLVLERSRTGAREVSLGDCGPCFRGGAGARTNACDSPDAVFEPRPSPGVVSELGSAARQQTPGQGRRNLAAGFQRSAVPEVLGRTCRGSRKTLRR